MILINPDPTLVMAATRELQLSQRKLAELIGVSLRTVQRHLRTGGVNTADHVHKLIAAVHPHNPDLAAKLAAQVHTDLVRLGLQAPPVREPPRPPPLPPAKREHADSVLCAAADALQMTPGNARPFVAAVFARARELGVDLNGFPQLFEGGARATKTPAPR